MIELVSGQMQMQYVSEQLGSFCSLKNLWPRSQLFDWFVVVELVTLHAHMESFFTCNEW